jgi:hypothetical protein
MISAEGRMQNDEFCSGAQSRLVQRYCPIAAETRSQRCLAADGTRAAPLRRRLLTLRKPMAHRLAVAGTATRAFLPAAVPAAAKRHAAFFF